METTDPKPKEFPSLLKTTGEMSLEELRDEVRWCRRYVQRDLIAEDPLLANEIRAAQVKLDSILQRVKELHGTYELKLLTDRLREELRLARERLAKVEAERSANFKWSSEIRKEVEAEAELRLARYLKVANTENERLRQELIELKAKIDIIRRPVVPVVQYDPELNKAFDAALEESRQQCARAVKAEEELENALNAQARLKTKYDDVEARRRSLWIYKDELRKTISGKDEVIRKLTEETQALSKLNEEQAETIRMCIKNEVKDMAEEEPGSKKMYILRLKTQARFRDKGLKRYKRLLKQAKKDMAILRIVHERSLLDLKISRAETKELQCQQNGLTDLIFPFPSDRPWMDATEVAKRESNMRRRFDKYLKVSCGADGYIVKRWAFLSTVVDIGADDGRIPAEWPAEEHVYPAGP